MKKTLTYTLHILALAAVISPLFAFAQNVQNFGDVIKLILSFVKMLIPLVIALTLLVFLWGIFQLVRSGSEDARKEAIAIITYGIISLFVMVSVWGLVQILTSTFFGGQLIYPQLK